MKLIIGTKLLYRARPLEVPVAGPEGGEKGAIS